MQNMFYSCHCNDQELDLWCLTPLSSNNTTILFKHTWLWYIYFSGVMVFDKYIQQYFNNIVALSFIGGGNRSTRRKPPTCPMTLTNYHIMLYRVHFPMGEIRTHTFNGKSNYHTITVKLYFLNSQSHTIYKWVA
jgi:hypothetical protein